MWRLVFFAGLTVAAFRYIKWTNARHVPDHDKLQTPKEQPAQIESPLPPSK